MSKPEKKVYVSLIPRKPSKAFISTFQSHCFNDALRPAEHAKKGTSSVHVVKVII